MRLARIVIVCQKMFYVQENAEVLEKAEVL